MMENPSSHGLLFEVFDDSSNDPCSSPGAYLPHSSPIMNSRQLRTPFEPEIEVLQGKPRSIDHCCILMFIPPAYSKINVCSSQ